MHKTLVLNANYQVIGFVSFRRVFKYLFSGKDKVEIISEWQDEVINTPNFSFKLPSILRLKKQIYRSYFQQAFSRKLVVKRDAGRCLYCNIKLAPSKITIDHVIPRSLGGTTSFSNCVVACSACNGKKSSKTLEQAGMKLLRKPMPPSFTTQFYLMDDHGSWHDDWNDYILSA